jgi:uncharacterized integral membrane protein
MADRTPTNRAGSRASASRTAMIWIFTIAALLLLVLLIVFILQNQDAVLVRYFGLEGQLPLGVALLIAAVAGGLLVAASGVARVTALRIKARREAKRHNGRPVSGTARRDAPEAPAPEPRRLDAGGRDARPAETSAERPPGERDRFPEG